MFQTVISSAVCLISFLMFLSFEYRMATVVSVVTMNPATWIYVLISCKSFLVK